MTTTAQLDCPHSVFVSSNSDSYDEVYIVDHNNHRIRKILVNGNIVTIAGNGKSGNSGDNGPATVAQLNCPSGVFVSSNEVYIADTYNHKIRKILTNGNIVTIAGTGQPGFSGDNGPASRAQLYCPSSVFVSADNEIFIADRSNHRIRKILTNGKIVTIAGNGVEGYSGDNCIATKTQLNNPQSVFVSPNNEVYIAEFKNHRIRKVLENGNIVTIAGTGQAGFSGDYGPATAAQLNRPYSVFVSANNEVYIADHNNHRIRKILKNGNIVTIAGNGKQAGYSGDNGPATSAQLNYPSSAFVSSNEIFITEKHNHTCRKISENGNIETIAGNGKQGYAGDSEFDISKYPHIGGFKYPQTLEIKLKKHSRDFLFESSICAFIPLTELLSPLFSKFVLKNEQLISSLTSNQQEIVQQLVDSLIYEKIELKFNDEQVLDVLFIIGLFKNNEFIELKKACAIQFIQSLDLQNLSKKWEEIELYLARCTNELHLENYILEYLHNYCVEFATIQMKTKEGSKYLPALPILTRNCVKIFSKIILSQPNPIILNETVEIEAMNIDQLYNDKRTSDLKIQMDENNYLHCHKTILSSTSSLFNAMFDSGSSFADFNNGVIIPEPSDDLELLEIVIKTCYRIPLKHVKSEKMISLFDMAMKHEIEYLVLYCKNTFRITIDNYFDTISACEDYFDLELFESFYKELVKYGIQNGKELFCDREILSRLPPKLCHAIEKCL